MTDDELWPTVRACVTLVESFSSSLNALIAFHDVRTATELSHLLTRVAAQVNAMPDDEGKEETIAAIMAVAGFAASIEKAMTYEQGRTEG